MLKLACGTLVALLLWGGSKTATAQPADAEPTEQPQTAPRPPAAPPASDSLTPPPAGEGQAGGQPAEQVITRAWTHDDHGRIVFDWPQTVGYTAGIHAGLLTVEFDRQMTTNLAQIRQHLGAYISEAVLDPNGRTFTATLTGDHHLRTFPLHQSGMTRIVLALRKAQPRATATAPSRPTATTSTETLSPPKGEEAQPTAPASTPPASNPGNAGRTPAGSVSNSRPPAGEGQAEGQPAEQVTTRAGAHNGYGRIVFDWPQTVGYTAGIHARRLTVEFDRQMTTDFAQIRQHLGAYVSEAVLDPNGRTFTATLTGDYHLRTFPLHQGGMIKIVLDLRKAQPRATATAPSPTPTASPAPTATSIPQSPTLGTRASRPQVMSPTPTLLEREGQGGGQPAQIQLQTAPPLTLPLGHSRLLRLDAPAGSVFVGNPDIADVNLVSSGVLHLVGKAIGRTSVAVLNAGGELLAAWTVATVIDVGPVQTALEGAQELKQISVRQLTKGVELSGTVASPAQADLAMRLAVAALPDEVPVANRLIVSGAQQVNLEVQIAEMNRSVSESLGINWEVIEPHRPGGFTGFRIGRSNFIDNEAGALVQAALPGGQAASLGTSQFINGTRLSALLDALATAGLASVLARPSLTAISGETASFFSGGEFPLPAGFEDGAIIFTYKKFGVLLDFVPTVVDSRRIVLTVRSEVSQRSETEAIQAAGVDIPVIDGRRAETTVEVGNGESIVIAGLYRDQSESRESGMPLLKDIPIVNMLFSTRSVRSSATELIVIVTARLTDAATIPQGRDETLRPSDANPRDQPSPGRRLRGYYY